MADHISTYYFFVHISINNIHNLSARNILEEEEELYYPRNRSVKVEGILHGPDVVLILCSYVVYTARCFISMCFFCPFSLLITYPGEEGAGLCAYRAFVC